MQKAATKPIHAPQREVTTSHDTQPHYERAKAAARFLKISETTLWHWAKTRDDFPKPIKAGTRVTLFDLTAIQAWLQGQMEGAA